MPKVVFKKRITCPHCNGWGTEPGMKLLKGAGMLTSNTDACPECWGFGSIWVKMTKEEVLAEAETM